MLCNLLTSPPKEKASYSFETPLSHANVKSENYDDRKSGVNEIIFGPHLPVTTDPKIPLHHMLQRSRISKDHLVDINILEEEVCYEAVDEDNQINDEQLHIKSEYTQSSNTEEQTEYQINDAHILEIKQEFPCGYSDFEDSQDTPKHDYPKIDSFHIDQHIKISDENTIQINVKEEAYHQDGNEDIQENPSELQIKSVYIQCSNIDKQTECEMMRENEVDTENYTKNRYIVNENPESKLLVPEIGVSNVYDHDLETNPFEHAFFIGNQSVPGQDDSTTPAMTAPEQATPKNNIRVKTPAERSREYRARKKARQNAADQVPPWNVPEMPQEVYPSKNSQESDGCPYMMPKKRKTTADYSREYRARKKALKHLQKKSKSAERGRDYRARKRAYMDLVEPIPIAPSIETVVANDSRAVDQHFILPEVDIDHTPDGKTMDDAMEGFQDTKMSATSALENNEDLENVPLVRMEDVQPDRSCEMINLQQMDRVDSAENGCLLNDDDSNIGSMVSIQSEEVADCQDESSDNAEMIVPEILQTAKDELYLTVKPLKPKVPESWPTLEILPGGVIKNADKYIDDLSFTCSLTDDTINKGSDMMYVCAKCSESFDNLIQLVKHVRWHEDERKKENELKLQTVKKCYIQTCKRKLISELKTKCKVPKRS